MTTRPKIPDLLPVVSPVSKFSIEERQIPYPPEIVSPVVNAVFGLDYIQEQKSYLTGEIIVSLRTMKWNYLKHQIFRP